MGLIRDRLARWPPTSRLAVCWLAALVVLATAGFSGIWWIGSGLAPALLGFLALGGVLILLVLGTVLIVAGVVAGCRSQTSALRRIGIGLTPVVLVGFGVPLILPIGVAVGRAMPWAVLSFNQARYERIIEKARPGERFLPADEAGSAHTGEGTYFEAERGPLHRIAFILPNHFLSDQQAILYDPTVYAREDGRPGVDIEREQASLFDGRLRPYECRRLWGRYLSCYLNKPGAPPWHGL